MNVLGCVSPANSIPSRRLAQEVMLECRDDGSAGYTVGIEA